MDKIHVIWHRVPDTDATISSIVFSEYLKYKWKKAAPYKLGNLNNETKFILNYVWVEHPETIEKLEPGSKVALVDHNERAQTIENIADLEIHSIIDHHKIGNLETQNPIFIRTEKLCSTSSIVYKMMKEEGITPNKEHATLIISAILSDSLHFRSPTTQDEDKFIVEELNEIAKIPNIEEYAMEMFKAKSDLWNISIEELIKIDYKEFEVNGKKLWVGSVETTNPNYSLSRKIEIISGMQKIKKEAKLDFVMLSVIDILNEKNTTILSDETDIKVIRDIFWTDVLDNLADLWPRISRKKQVIPELTAYFNKN